MNLSEKIQWLHTNVGKHVAVREWDKFLGFFPVSTKWWLTIEDDGDHWGIYRTSGKHTHVRVICGNVYLIDVRKTDGTIFSRHGLSGAYKTALNLHPIRDEEEAIKVFNSLSELIGNAFDDHFRVKI
jgi:hypothetical protein